MEFYTKISTSYKLILEKLKFTCILYQFSFKPQLRLNFGQLSPSRRFPSYNCLIHFYKRKSTQLNSASYWVLVDLIYVLFLLERSSSREADFLLPPGAFQDDREGRAWGFRNGRWEMQIWKRKRWIK